MGVKNAQNLDHVIPGWPLLKCSLEDWSFFIGPAIAHWLHLQNIYKKLISRRNDIFSATIKPIFMNATLSLLKEEKVKLIFEGASWIMSRSYHSME